jgi:DNA primase
MPAIDYRRARAELRLADVLALIGYEPRVRQGPQWRGPCPLHGARSATSRVFAAHLSKGLYPCFRCGAGGNALDLWAALRRLPLHAAVLDLCAHLQRPVPWLPKARPRRPPAAADKPQPSVEEARAMPDP